MQHYFVTAENIDDVREEITALDQRAEIEVGCETWSITYQPGSITAVSDEVTSFKRMIDELKKQHVAELAEAMKSALDRGIEEGRRLQKQDTAKLLGLT